jgi:hypothetical protein
MICHKLDTLCVSSAKDYVVVGNAKPLPNLACIVVTVKGSSCPAWLKKMQATLASLNGVISVDVCTDLLSTNQDAQGAISRRRRHLATYTIRFNRTCINKQQISRLMRAGDFVIRSTQSAF